MIHIDIETYSPVDLKKAGVYAYAEHPDALVLMMAWAVDDDPVEVFTDTDDITDRVKFLAESTDEIMAHNAQFERVVLCGPGSSAERWVDPMMLAAEFGLPMKLDTLAKVLGVTEKDSAGTRLINMFSKPNRKGVRTLPEDRPEQWAEFVAYCAQDVATMREAYAKLTWWPTELERRAYVLDQKINDRGIRADLIMARAAVTAAEDNKLDDMERSRQITNLGNPNSVQQLTAWLTEGGLELKNLQATTVAKLLEEGELTEDQREVLTLRQGMALSSSSKYQAVVDGISGDGRLRGQFRFLGAHTGRWSGRGVQLQNLPRAYVPMLDKDAKIIEQMKHDELNTKAFEHAALKRSTDAAAVDLKLGARVDDPTLKALIRPMLIGPFTVVDYSAIEARVLAWLAGERWVVEAFEAGRDIYVETAERMGGLTRQQGKVAVLALGYGGGVKALNRMNGEPMDNASGLVDAYRQTVPMIRRFWRLLESSFGNGGQLGDHLEVKRVGVDRHVMLPSGRPLVYRRVRWDRYIVIDPDTEQREVKESWRFDGRLGRSATWGGSLTENVVQAVARDLLAHAMVELDRAGYDIVGHVHDEVIVEGTHDPEVMGAVMTTNPSWATGLPLAAEGHNCDRYTKG